MMGHTGLPLLKSSHLIKHRAMGQKQIMNGLKYFSPLQLSVNKQAERPKRVLV